MALSELLSTAAVFLVGMAHEIRLQTVCFVVGQIAEPVEGGGIFRRWVVLGLPPLPTGFRYHRSRVQCSCG